MPVTPSARKALRNAEAKQERNSLIKAELKRVLKNATAENVSQVVSFVDKAAKRMVIHPNKAARLKSQLSKLEAGEAVKKTVTKRASNAKKAATKAKAKAAKAVKPVVKR